jgi:hypothetical protein
MQQEICKMEVDEVAVPRHFHLLQVGFIILKMVNLVQLTVVYPLGVSPNSLRYREMFWGK